MDTYRSGDTYQTGDGDTVIHTQIGNRVYECIAAPDEPRTIIADTIYNEQPRRLHLDRLSRIERKREGLSIRLFERYIAVLPVNIGQYEMAVPNAVISNHTEGRGPCIGGGASSNYGNTRRTSCGFGVGFKFSFKGSEPDWCVLGQDVLGKIPENTHKDESA